MLKTRSFLMGLGLGVIIGALLFQLMLSRSAVELVIGEQAEPDPNPAASAQAVVQQPSPEEDLLPETTEAPAAAAQTEAPQTEAPQTEAPQKPAATPEPSQSAPPEQTSATVEPTAAAFVLRIKPGMNLTDTAELLAAREVVPSGPAFIQQMNKQRKVVRAGLFLFKPDMTVEEAIQVVTSQPLTREQAELIAGGPVD